MMYIWARLRSLAGRSDLGMVNVTFFQISHQFDLLLAIWWMRLRSER